MFKRLLKFLKGPEVVESVPFEGSYLDHLLDQTSEEIEAQLKACPDHDPLLLFVVGILRRTMLDAFSSELREPLVDLYSPGMSPPPPPGGQRNSFMSLEHDLQVKDFREDEAFEILSVEEEEAEAAKRSEHKTEEMSAEEIQRHAQSNSPVDTHEIPISIGEDSEAEFVASNRIDSPATLLAGRRFLEILVANDSLAPDIQLDMSNLFLVRDHLMSRGSVGPEVETIMRRLLSLVEKKFNEAHFGQARILLKLFPTDDLTSLNNDRNIFYEEMILKLGIKRRHKIDDKDLEHLRSMVSLISADELPQTFEWFREKSGIRFHVNRISQSQSQVWKSLLSASTRPDLESYTKAYFPKKRWREVEDDEDAFELIVNSLSKSSAQDFVVSLLGTCYFVLRAVGDTGLEPFLDAFFDWCTAVLDFNATLLMPMIHRGAMTDSRMMEDILQGLYDAHLREKVEALYDEWSEEDIEKISKEIFTDLAISTLGEVAPGDYNLCAFAIQKMLKFEYPSPEFAYKVHRLS